MSGRLPRPRDGAAALVTGASAGIGEELARQLAARGHTVVLVARRKARLNELARELRAEGARAEVVACDLARERARDRLVTRIAELGLEIDVLANNAGFATGGPFHRTDAAREVEQVRVLVEAPVALAAAFAGGMVERRCGAILTVASTAAFQPLPWSAGYAAAKAHALAFSESLHEELRPLGVSVTALCPGPVRTDFWEVAGGDHPAQRSFPRQAWISSRHAARAGLAGLDRGDRIVVPGFAVRATTTLGRALPNAVRMPVVRRLLEPRERAAS
ncbi:MAG TPA: SDR family oxidoreductase [Baekduia sp.]|nr:SDR family oxidoreductase [Baekduia sp.]